MRHFTNFVTIYALLCACTPDSNNIGETLTTGGETGASTGEQTAGTTEDPTDATGATSDAASTMTGDSTGAVDTTTDDMTGQTSAGETTLDDLTTSGASGEDSGDSTSDDTGDDTGGDGFACGEMTCDAATQYCSVFLPGIMDAEIVYNCAQIPARCNGTPTCACLPDGEAPPCQCAEDQGFTVTCAGA